MSTSAVLQRSKSVGTEAIGSSCAAGLRIVHALLEGAVWVFLSALVITMFRPPDVNLYHLDRVAFGILVFVVVLRILLLGRPFPIVRSISIPMLVLVALVGCRAAAQPYDAQTWSLFAAEFLVPFALFHLAAAIFIDRSAVQKFEIFAWCALAYLSFTAIASLVGATKLVFPPFILDEDLGIHADRARGPFLQAVANGVVLTILGLIALDAYRRRRVRGIPAFLLLGSLPFAVLATMTRAVWFGFVVAAACLIFREPRFRRAALGLLVLCAVGLTTILAVDRLRTALVDRAIEGGPVEIRAAIYRASWDMILERPLLGWGPNQMPAEIAERMTDYDLERYWAHNTYLEILVENGVLGLTLYVFIIVGLFKLGRPRRTAVTDLPLRSIWPIALGVYLFNALFVVMNYQFVNALLFTMSGIVGAQNRDNLPRASTDYFDWVR